jgi:hypothetical protein
VRSLVPRRARMFCGSIPARGPSCAHASPGRRCPTSPAERLSNSMPRSGAPQDRATNARAAAPFLGRRFAVTLVSSRRPARRGPPPPSLKTRRTSGFQSPSGCSAAGAGAGPQPGSANVGGSTAPPPGPFASPRGIQPGPLGADLCSLALGAAGAFSDAKALPAPARPQPRRPQPRRP